MTAQYEVAERRGLPEAADIAEQLVALSATIGEAQRSVPALAARARQTLRVQGIEAAMPAFEQAMAATVNLRLSAVRRDA